MSCRNPRPIVFAVPITGQIIRTWKPCGCWDCPTCREVVQAKWQAAVTRNLADAPGYFYQATLAEPDWRSRVYPEINRTAKKFKTQAQYYAIWLGGTVTVFSTVPFRGSEKIHRRQAVGRLRALIGQQKKTRTRPITCSHGWGPDRQPAGTGWEFMGVGVPTEYLSQAASEVRMASYAVLESGGAGLRYTLSAAIGDAFDLLRRKVRLACGAAHSKASRISSRISRGVESKASEITFAAVNFTLDSG